MKISRAFLISLFLLNNKPLIPEIRELMRGNERIGNIELNEYESFSTDSFQGLLEESHRTGGGPFYVVRVYTQDDAREYIHHYHFEGLQDYMRINRTIQSPTNRLPMQRFEVFEIPFDAGAPGRQNNDLTQAIEFNIQRVQLNQAQEVLGRDQNALRQAQDALQNAQNQFEQNRRNQEQVLQAQEQQLQAREQQLLRDQEALRLARLAQNHAPNVNNQGLEAQLQRDQEALQRDRAALRRDREQFDDYQNRERNELARQNIQLAHDRAVLNREQREENNRRRTQNQCDSINNIITTKSLIAKTLIHAIHTPIIFSRFKEKSIQEEINFILNNYDAIKEAEKNGFALKNLLDKKSNAMTFKDTFWEALKLNIAQLITIVPFLRYLNVYTPRAMYRINGAQEYYASSNCPSNFPFLIAIEMLLDSAGVLALIKTLEDRSLKLAEVLIEKKDEIARLAAEYQTALKNNDDLEQNIAKSELAKILEPTHATLFEEIRNIFTKGTLGSKIKGLTLKTAFSALGILISEKMLL